VELLLKIDQVQLLTFQKCLRNLQHLHLESCILHMTLEHLAYDVMRIYGEEEGYHGVHDFFIKA
jgi:hypothetical protein